MKLKKTLALSLAAITIGACICIAPSSAATVDNAQVQSINQQIQANKDKQDQLSAELNNLQGELDNAWEQKLVIDKLVDATVQQQETLTTLIKQLEAEITELSERDIETTKQIEEQRAAFLERMVALHEDGTVSYLELIFGAEDLNTFLTKYDYVTSMLDYDKKVISDLKATKEELAKTREQKEAALAEQKASKEYYDSESARLESLKASQDAVVNSIKNNVSKTESLKNQAEAEEDALDAKLTETLLEIQRQEELAKQQAEQQQQQQQQEQQKQPATNYESAPGVSNDGSFMWPLMTGYVSSPFGYRPFNGGEFHRATDIACATGTPIYAANSGTVVTSQWHDSYGNYVLINHGGGYATLYAHMSTRLCSAGQYVEKGSVIGLVGNTGFSFGSHLHFEFRINGQCVDAEEQIPH